MKRLLSVTGFTALLTLLKMSTGFIIAKFIAVYTGPTGMAMLGQVQSVINILNGLANAPVGVGVVRYTAANIEQGFESCSGWWKASLQWVFVLLIIIIPLGLLLSGKLSNWLFGNDEYYWLIIISCCVLPLSVANTLIISIINGQQKYKRYITLGIVSNIISTIVMIFLIYTYQMKGALIAAVINTSISGIIVVCTSVRLPWFKFKYFFGTVDLEHKKKIGGYVLMALTTALTVPVSLIIVRNILVSELGWYSTGQWQAVWKISEVYLSIITISLSTYYLPRLSSINDINAIREEINKTVIIVLPIAIVLALFVYIFRDFAINLLFTNEFKEARNLFAIQLCGDVVKVLAWLYAYPMLSRGATKWFVSLEIVFSTLFCILSYFLVSLYGISGVLYAYLINYTTYLFFIFINFKRIMS